MGRFGWRALLRNRTALTGTVITSFVLLAIVIGAELMPYSATDMDFINILAPPASSIRSARIHSGGTSSPACCSADASPSSSVAPGSRSAARSA